MKKLFTPPKIVFFDIDNTLYITEEKHIPDSAVLALKKLKQQGIIVAIATGRTIAVLPEKIRQLIADNGIDMVVCINGQFVQYQGKTLVSFPLNPDEVLNLAQQFSQRNISYAFVSDVGICVGLLDDCLREATTSVAVAYLEDKYFPKQHAVYQMLGFYEPAKDTEIATFLPVDFKTVRWHRVGVDILAKQGSKARGIQAALNALGLHMEDAMAFGDGLNDMEMIQAVGFGVVMDNGEPELKAIADYICPRVDDDGIYRALVDLGVIC